MDEEKKLEKQFATPFGESYILQFGLPSFIIGEQMKNVPKVIFMIPGNPGSICLYQDLMEKLYLKFKIPVIGTSHTGSFRGSQSNYYGTNSCEEKIREKEDFISKYIPPETKIIFVGQSFGCYIAIHLMKNERIRKQTDHLFMLTPAIERLNEATGYYLTLVFRPLRYIYYPLVYLISFLSEETIAKGLGCFPQHFAKGIANILTIPSIENCFQLGRDEFEQIKERDDKLIKTFAEKCTLIYAPRDEWVPSGCPEDIKKTHQECNVQVIQDINHIFFVVPSQQEKVMEAITSRMESILNSNMV